MDRPLLLAGRDLHTDTRTPVHAPWDGRVLCQVSQAGPVELEAACAAAERAFEATRALPAHRRASILRAVAAQLRAHQEELAGLIRDEGGKPIQLARAEVGRAVETFLLSAEEATRIAGELAPLDASPLAEGRWALIRRVPRGPVLAITPFNFPLNLVAHKVAPAVAAGCPVVLKPAEQTPSAALLLGRLLVEAGWPEGAVSVVPCDRTVADALIADPRLPVLSFTGSDRVGWYMRQKAPRKTVALELGGNAAAILEPDADLDRALPRLAVGAYAYAGQVCISVQRILAHQDIYDAVVERFVTEAARVPRGDPGDERVVCGPMIDGANADRVQGWIAEAVGAGARMLGGGRDGRVLAPSLLLDVPPGARIRDDEVFGPTVLVERYAALDEAIDLVNRGRYGLQAGLYTRDVGKVWRAFDRMEVGAIIHDDFPTFRVDGMPYGGVKDSGVGREGPRWAIRDFTEERLLVLRT
jgi:acyl-CoA reductase-like NAD-dependent aldehyde dehydrogenase